jgi:hypothetical protein
LSNDEIQDFSLVIYNTLKFESAKPPHNRFPLVAIFLHTLLFLIRLGLQTLIGAESTKEIPVESPKQQVFKNKVIAIKF